MVFEFVFSRAKDNAKNNEHLGLLILAFKI